MENAKRQQLIQSITNLVQKYAEDYAKEVNNQRIEDSNEKTRINISQSESDFDDDDNSLFDEIQTAFNRFSNYNYKMLKMLKELKSGKYDHIVHGGSLGPVKVDNEIYNLMNNPSSKHVNFVQSEVQLVMPSKKGKDVVYIPDRQTHFEVVHRNDDTASNNLFKANYKEENLSIME